MSFSPFVFLLLFISSILCFMMNSWITIWVVLEMNTLAFCCLMKTLSMEKKTVTEMSMKYFIIQSISSSLLIFSMMFFNLMNKFILILMFMGLTALMIKMGATPFHQWFVSMVKTSKWWNSTVLMTWQKLAPVFLVIYQSKLYLYPFMIFSVLVGSISQMNKVNIMEIMAFSSIFNLSWMMLAISVNSKLLILFSFIYWSSVVMIMVMISKSKMYKINSENMSSTKKWIYFLVAINLAGIPPMAGFLAKWMVFSEMLKLKLIFLMTVFLVMSSINLYIYLRFLNYSMTKMYLKTQKKTKETSNFMTKMILLMNLFPLMFMAIYSMRL